MRYHRLGGKVTTIKGEFKQQDDKLDLCIYCIFLYFGHDEEDVRNTSSNRSIAGCTGTYLTDVRYRCLQTRSGKYF